MPHAASAERLLDPMRSVTAKLSGENLNVPCHGTVLPLVFINSGIFFITAYFCGTGPGYNP